jgi:hypothetical protein
MHISAEAIGWMVPSGTNSLPTDEQTDYHKKYSQLKYLSYFHSVVYIMEERGRLWNSGVRVVHYRTCDVDSEDGGYINCTTQWQLIIPPQQGRWKWLMAVLDSLQIHWILHEARVNINSNLPKNHKNAYLPNMRNFEIYISFTCSHFVPKFQKIE